MKDNQSESSIENVINGLVNSYQQELSEYKELLKLTNKQQQAIKSNNWEQLNQVTQNKRELMRKIDRLEEEVLDLQEQIAAELDLQIGDKFYPELIKTQLPGTQELYQVLRQVYSLMEQINELNEKNQAQMEEEKQKKQQRLKEINQGMTANKAYGGYSDNSEGKFIDQTD